MIILVSLSLSRARFQVNRWGKAFFLRGGCILYVGSIERGMGLGSARACDFMALLASGLGSVRVPSRRLVSSEAHAADLSFSSLLVSFFILN